MDEDNDDEHWRQYLFAFKAVNTIAISSVVAVIASVCASTDFQFITSQAAAGDLAGSKSALLFSLYASNGSQA